MSEEPSEAEASGNRPETTEEACQRIAFEIVQEAPKIAELLVLVQRTDGTGTAIDTGLTVDRAKVLVMSFHSWLDQCLGRDIERAEKR